MRCQIETFLAPIAGREHPAALIEVRWREAGGFRRRFFPIAQLHTAGEFIERVGARTDVYVGVAPRTREHGGLEAISQTWTLWADVDGSVARLALAEFDPAPTMVVRTGSGVNVHAYWALESPLRREPGRDHVRRAMRRVACALGADMASTDAARILRPPGFNWKHGEPRPVYIESFTGEVYAAGDVVAQLPDPIDQEAPPAMSRRRDATRPVDDPLLAIPSSEYVPRLTGRPVRRDGKVQCPVHAGGQERTPSLQTWDDPARGWFCWGACQRGGSIYDFGALLWGLATRGDDFVCVRERLLLEFAPHAVRSAA